VATLVFLFVADAIPEHRNSNEAKVDRSAILSTFLLGVGRRYSKHSWGFEKYLHMAFEITTQTPL